MNGATGKHIWDIHLDKALGKPSLYVREDGTLFLEVPYQ